MPPTFKTWLEKFFNKIKINENEFIDIIRNVSNNASSNSNNSNKIYKPISKISYFKDNPNDEFASYIDNNSKQIFIQKKASLLENVNVLKRFVRKASFSPTDSSFGGNSKKLIMKNREARFSFYENDNKIYEENSFLKPLESKYDNDNKFRELVINEKILNDEYIMRDIPNRFKDDSYFYDNISQNQKKILYENILYENLIEEKKIIIKSENLYEESKKIILTDKNDVLNEISKNKTLEKTVKNLLIITEEGTKEHMDVWNDEKNWIKDSIKTQIKILIEDKLKDNLDECISMNNTSNLEENQISNEQAMFIKEIFEKNIEKNLNKMINDNDHIIEKEFKRNIINNQIMIEDFRVSIDVKNKYGKEGLNLSLEIDFPQDII